MREHERQVSTRVDDHVMVKLKVKAAAADINVAKYLSGLIYKDLGLVEDVISVTKPKVA